MEELLVAEDLTGGVDSIPPRQGWDAVMGRAESGISTAVAMLIRLEWPMHSAEQPTNPEGDHGRGIGLRLDSVT
jgi:hypothetical protein